MAASTTFIIYNTAGQPVTAIQANTLDGPGGVQQSSDLMLYGLGFPNWGEGVDENDYRIVESFACPALSNFPASARYSLLGPVVSAATPAGEASDELGAGNGINHPLVGQLWYNTTQGKLYVNTNAYPAPLWTTVGTQAVAIGIEPLTPSLGQLWYNATVPMIGVTLPQLMVWNGASWDSVANFYLPLAGGTVSGTLTMGSTIAMGGNKITNLAPGTNSQDAVNFAQMTSAISGAGSLYLPTAGGTMTGALNMNSNQILNASYITVGASGISSTGTVVSTSAVAFDASNGRIINVGSPSTLTDAINSTSGDLRWLNKSTGGNVTGLTSFTNPVTIPLTPTVPTQAASKGYVDSAIASGFSSNMYATAAYSTWVNSVTPWSGTGSIGYCKYPNGMIDVWGVTPAAAGIIEGGTTVALPAAIGSMRIVSQTSSVLVNIANYNQQDQAGQVYFQPNVLTSSITIILQYMAGGSAAGGVYVSWFARGY